MGNQLARQITNEDIIIPVIGLTGAGKSTFINTATKSTLLTVGRPLKPCTKTVKHVRCPHPSRKNCYVVFVDTPALDPDDRVSDVETKLRDWMHSLRNIRSTVDGIIYLHRITDNKITEAPVSNLLRFDDICGGHVFEKVLLVTTMWSLDRRGMGPGRENELRGRYWGSIMEPGPKMHRFEDTTESAWAAVDVLLNDRQD